MDQDYGLWPLVIINSLLLIVFAGSFVHPLTQRDWGFLAIMVGFLLTWPTIPTLVMFPALVYVCWRLARTEEREVAARFPDTWPAYAASVDRCRPRRPTAAFLPPAASRHVEPEPNPKENSDARL